MILGFFEDSTRRQTSSESVLSALHIPASPLSLYRLIVPTFLVLTMSAVLSTLRWYDTAGLDRVMRAAMSWTLIPAEPASSSTSRISCLRGSPRAQNPSRHRLNSSASLVLLSELSSMNSRFV